ncbi:hypothetical protein [Microbacterium sp.]|uniref:hypothetical protein n=1 Tax=Microbacterium sp. TaxID=51671 RepID=UPI003C781AE2
MRARGRRRGRRTSGIERIIGPLVIAAACFGVWMYNGQPDVLAWFTSRPAAPATAGQASATPSNVARTWSCVWDPTRDDDWHNDVECFDGTTRFRPNLLTDIAKVDESQMRAAGQEYEAYLNAGGIPQIPTP